MNCKTSWQFKVTIFPLALRKSRRLIGFQFRPISDREACFFGLWDCKKISFMLKSFFIAKSGKGEKPRFRKNSNLFLGNWPNLRNRNVQLHTFPRLGIERSTKLTCTGKYFSRKQNFFLNFATRSSYSCLFRIFLDRSSRGSKPGKRSRSKIGNSCRFLAGLILTANREKHEWGLKYKVGTSKRKKRKGNGRWEVGREEENLSLLPYSRKRGEGRELV